ncbi:condensation domain-containing protein [Nonomuraea angiospora]|uniref:condensation domain-containing protein n=1 Tax=Nonomuraea angiospora TaxID=46172 RepID=UPI0029AB369A|nr:condensation domain-containing protein [Nonomuraea angiospora]MDX3099609.1 condensation domain-containing protein [Nonomuraea angiospora]
MSPAEERFWMAYMFEDQSSAYHIPITFRLTGHLDVAALEGALSTVLTRHDILRTRYLIDADGELTAVVDDPRSCELVVVPAGDDPQALLDAATEAPFDLETGPLLRPLLLRAATGEHYLHFTVHHIVTDGWSIGNLINELTLVYNARVSGGQPDLPELTMQYRDHALQQRARAGELAGEVAFWRQALSGAPRELGLRTDHPRRSHVKVPGRSVMITFPKQAALDIARRSKSTVFMVLLAAYSVVLGRRAGHTDVVVGTPIAGRRDPVTEPLMGCFINTLVMRTDLSGDPTFKELLLRVRQWTLQAYENQDVPFEQIVDAVIERTGTRSTLIQAWLALQNFPDPALDLVGLDAEDVYVTTPATKFDVTFYVDELDDVMELEVEYDSSLFDEGTIRDLADEFAGILTTAVRGLDQRLSELTSSRPRALS